MSTIDKWEEGIHNREGFGYGELDGIAGPWRGGAHARCGKASAEELGAVDSEGGSEGGGGEEELVEQLDGLEEEEKGVAFGCYG